MVNKIYEQIKKPIHGTIQVPGDKSISHRAVMFGAISKGRTIVDGFLMGDDCLHTISCFKSLGVSIKEEHNQIIIDGQGLDGLKEPPMILDVGNSGTTIRLILGILAGRPFHSVLTGDASINKRPMARVVHPLREMGAMISGREDGNFAPLAVNGRNLKAFSYQTPVASAQVKSALLFAGLQAQGTTTITEPALSRDHTERMIKAFGGQIETKGTTHTIEGGQQLRGCHIQVPGDISSAAFFIALALLVPDSDITITNVGINPTRIGIINVLKRMGASIQLENERLSHYEPVADLRIQNSNLKGITIGGDDIPSLIDEIPIIALIALRANGKTVIQDAAELKVKETNRIDTVVSQLKNLGATIEATEDGMIIYGDPSQTLTGGKVASFGDHRIGMMLAIASSIATSQLELEQSEAISVSFPTFNETLEYLK